MKIRFSSHSLERIKERGIARKDIIGAIKFPDKIEISKVAKNRFLVKKVYYHQELKKDHLLMIICEKEKDILKIVTIIDTSKISKYL